MGCLSGGWLMAVIAAASGSESDRRHVWQPVHEYFAYHGAGGDGGIGYTHIGTDFGRMGDDRAITFGDGSVRIAPTGRLSGVWHSLAGLARETHQTLDFSKCQPEWIANRWQSRVVGLKVRARGAGALRIELKGATDDVLWQRRFTLEGDGWVDLEAPLQPASLRSVKFLNWVAEPGTAAVIDGVWIEIETPRIDFDEHVLAVSYAKLSRCYSRKTGMVRDREHFEAGTFDSIPASGMFCLATAVAAQQGGVDRAFALEVLRRTHAIVGPMASSLGLLPHFAIHGPDGWRISPGTEFSTVDSAIYLHSIRLAASILGDSPTEDAIARTARKIDFSTLRDAEGFIVHGTRDDGVTRLPDSWRDWGGESALVLLLARLAEGSNGVLRMRNDGRVFAGVGFIAELQSLFFPQFDNDRADALTGVSWRSVRRELFDAQRRYFSERLPHSTVNQLGAYGLSAGEGRAGRGYSVAGVEMAGQSLIHPHYMMMSATLAADPADVYERLWRMEDAGWFTPWGLVENIAADTGEYLPMNGSLNAAFESLGAYHALVRNRGGKNSIYEAAQSCAALSEATRLFAKREADATNAAADVR